MMDIKLDFEDAHGWMTQLKDLPLDVQTNAIKPGLRAGAKVLKKQQITLLQQYIAETPDSKSKGILAQALKAVTIRDTGLDGTKTAAVLVGIVRKSGPILAPAMASKGKAPFYWIFFDKGYDPHGNSAHHKAARPFISDSLPGVQDQVVYAIEDALYNFFAGYTRKQKI